MKKSRGKFSSEFKQEAVDLVGRTGKSVNQIAQELGVAQTSLNRWVREAKSSPEQDNVFAGQAELRQLRKEVERLKMERDILKKATALQRPKSPHEVSICRGGEGALSSERIVSGIAGIAQRLL